MATANDKTPPAASRILKILHAWPDSEAGRNAKVAELQSGGFGGFVTNVNFGEGYVTNPKNWEALRAGIAAMRKAGLELWLYDEAGYPSGRAGGLVLKDHPEREARALLATKSGIVGPGPVAIPCPPGKLVLARAYPANAAGEITLTGAVELPPAGNGKFTWTAPAGRWQLLAVSEDRLFDGSQVDFSGVPEHAHYISLLDPEVVSAFLQITHERYAKELGNDLGKIFVSTFTDEPSLLADYYAGGMPWSPIAWHPSLAAEFAKRTGRQLSAELPWLFLDGPGAARTRYDFWLTVAEQFRTNYFVRIRAWCRAHHIPSGGHLLLEEDLRHHVPLYGDFFACERELDVPGIDVLAMNPVEAPWYTARLASSAGELEGATLVMSETTDFVEMWAKPPKPVSLAQFRGTINRLMLGGINRFNTYSHFRDFSEADLKALNLWTGRGCQALTGGLRNARIAVLYPIHTAWTRFKPSHQGVSDAGLLMDRLAGIFSQVNNLLYINRREFSQIDARTLVEAKAARAELRFKNLAFSVIVLPDTDTLPAAAWEKLKRFWENGGVVIAAGSRPLNTEGEFPSAAARACGDLLFGKSKDSAAPSWAGNAQGGLGIYLPPNRVQELPAILDQVLEPDIRVSDARSPVRITRRSIAGRDIFLIINDSPHPWRGTITFDLPARAGELLDLATGDTTPLPNPASVDLVLEDWGAAILRLDPSAHVTRLKPTTIAFANPEPPQKALPLPGEVFLVQGRTAFVILPQTKPAPGPIPWVWYAPTLPGLPGEEEKWMFQHFTEAGCAIAGIDVGESYGSPEGRALYSAFYDELTRQRGFAPKAVMLGRSRGGLMTLGWATENADKVAGFAGIYPVCNLASYPGLEAACGAYHLSKEELSERLAEYNPIDRLASLAKAGVPLFAIQGDSDTVVPLEANSGEMCRRYEALGGKMQLIVPPGQGHNMWPGFFQCQELVDFVLAREKRSALPPDK